MTAVDRYRTPDIFYQNVSDHRGLVLANVSFQTRHTTRNDDGRYVSRRN